MGTRLAGNLCGGISHVLPGGLDCPTRAAGRERDGIDIWRSGIWIHDFCCSIGRAEAGAHVANWPRESVDARTPMAGLAVASGGLLSWRLSFLMVAQQSADVAS